MLKLLTSSKSLIIISAIGIGTSLVMLYRSTNTNLDNKGGDPVAMVVRPQNDVRVKQSGVLHWNHLKDSTMARSGDTIFAGENSSTTIVLNKGSEITLMPHSLIVVQDNMLDLETGSLKINLKPNEKITHIKVAGKKIKLEQPGELTVQQVGKEVKVELKPEAGGPVIDLLQTAAVVELSDEPGEIIATEAKPEPAPISRPAPKVEPIARVLAPKPIIKPKPQPVSEPVEEKIEPAAVPESSPKEEIIALDKKYELYYLLGQTGQSHDVTLQGAGIDAAKSYSVSGLSHEVRLEAFKLLLKPVAFTAHYTDLSTSTASYKGYGGAFEIIFKSPFAFLPNVEFIPGVYFRQYTLGLKDLIPGGTGASEAASSSTMASFMIRWRRDFDLWTAEVWPLLKAHQKDKILLDYVLLSAIGRNTRYGRFSVFHKFIQNEDTLGYSEASNENANVKTRENKVGLMYVRGF